MAKHPEPGHDEIKRLDREYTGDAVNARTPEVKRETERDARRLDNRYADHGDKDSGKTGTP